MSVIMNSWDASTQESLQINKVDRSSIPIHIDSQLELDAIEVVLNYNVPFTTLHMPRPVSVVTTKDGTEDLRYRSTHMKRDKIYEIIWNGIPYGVVKTKDGVEIMRFKPDSK